jgi:DNA-binding NtrC family response regulator
MRSRILIAQRTDIFPRDFVAELTQRHIEVIEACSSTEVYRCLENCFPDLLVVYSSADTAPATLALAREVRRRFDKLPLVFVAKHSSEELAIAVLRTGFNDYFKPPVSPVELADALERFISRKSVCEQRPVRVYVVPDPSPAKSSLMLGESAAMRRIRHDLPRISASECNVLVTGETGTGKELIAESLHSGSARRDKPLVRINCAAVPDSLFESELFGYERGAFTGAHASKDGKLKLADGGSVFLDEIGDMSLFTQAKMLRVLENKEIDRLGGTKVVPVDVRVIAATNRDLEQLVANGQFRGDLFFRLDVVRIHLPPLRSRKEDIPLLVDDYIRKLNSRLGCEVDGLTKETLDCLLQYDWPGNVRELKNLLESVFVNAPERRIELSDLPTRFLEKLRIENRSQDDREKLLSALLASDWNKSRAAEKLRWSRMTLYRKMVKFGVHDGRIKRRTRAAQISENRL